MRIYRLNTGESAGSAATKSLSVSNGSPSPVMTELRDSEMEARLSRRVGAGHYGTLGREQMYRHRGDTGYQVITGDMTQGAQMSHSYTLPHSLSHHSSKIDILYFTFIKYFLLKASE